MNSSERKTPEPIKRLLRQEAGFGCCKCGHPFIEYHHIEKFADGAHHRLADMMVLCESCHRQVTNGVWRISTQRAWKASPFNIAQGRTKGQLVHDSPIVAIRIGSNILYGPGIRLAVENHPLLGFRQQDGVLLLSLDTQFPNTKGGFRLVNNEWLTPVDHLWDIEYHYNLIRVRSAKRKIEVTIDARQRVISVAGRILRNGRGFNIGNDMVTRVNKDGTGGSIGRLGLVAKPMNLLSNGNLDIGQYPGYSMGYVCSGDPLLAMCHDAMKRFLEENRHIDPATPCFCGSGETWPLCCAELKL